MPKIATHLFRIPWIIAVSLLLIVPALGESASASESCTSTTGLHCESYGSGDPIIALHGLGGTLYSWRNLKGAFPNHQLILIDLKGAGDSPKPRDKHYSIQDQVDLIYQFILEHDLKNLTVMGNSYGGAVSLVLAIQLCRDDPDRFASLILIDSGGYNKDLPSHLKILKTPVIGWLALHLRSVRASIKQVLRDSYYDRDKITDEQIDAYTKPVVAPGGRYGMLQTARQAIPKNIDAITAQYKNISVPTLILWGLDDRLIPITIGEMLHEAIPRSSLEIINNCGHVPQEEMPEETIRYISAFFRRIGQKP